MYTYIFCIHDQSDEQTQILRSKYMNICIYIHIYIHIYYTHIYICTYSYILTVIFLFVRRFDSIWTVRRIRGPYFVVPRNFLHNVLNIILLFSNNSRLFWNRGPFRLVPKKKANRNFEQNIT